MRTFRVYSFEIRIPKVDKNKQQNPTAEEKKQEQKNAIFGDMLSQKLEKEKNTPQKKESKSLGFLQRFAFDPKTEEKREKTEEKNKKRAKITEKKILPENIIPKQKKGKPTEISSLQIQKEEDSSFNIQAEEKIIQKQQEKKERENMAEGIQKDEKKPTSILIVEPKKEEDEGKINISALQKNNEEEKSKKTGNKIFGFLKKRKKGEEKSLPLVLQNTEDIPGQKNSNSPTEEEIAQDPLLAVLPKQKKQKETQETEQNPVSQEAQKEEESEEKKVSNILAARIQSSMDLEREEETQEESEKILAVDFQKAESKEAAKKENRVLLLASRFALALSCLLPLSSFIVFQTILVENSGLSQAIESENHGTKLAELKEGETKKNTELTNIETKIKNAEREINDIENNQVLSSIVDNRVDFLEIMLRINGITLQSLDLTPEINRAISMLVFNSYSGSVEDENIKITISGTVRDPKRMSFTKLTQLMETINEDKYFSGASIRSFSKIDDDEGGARSSFTFNFAYHPNGEKILAQTNTTQ